ncbi:rod-binding protein [Deltaproteobacteria bacterium TL4]
MKPIENFSIMNQQLLQQAQNLKSRKLDTATKESELKEVANEFEALFVNEMLKSMRDSIGDSGIMPKGDGEKMFESMLDGEYSRAAAKTGRFGLAASIYQQLKKNIR